MHISAHTYFFKGKDFLGLNSQYLEALTKKV